MVKRDIITDQFLWAATSTHDLAGLFYTDSAVSNCSHQSPIDLFLVKDLAGVEGHREIEIRGGDLSQCHQRFYSHTLPRENDEIRMTKKARPPERRPVRASSFLRPSTFRASSFIEIFGKENPLCTCAILCHLRSAWTLGSASIAPFSFFISSSSSRSASTWAGKKKI